MSKKFKADILKLQELGLAKEIIHVNPGFNKNDNRNAKIDFILENLK